MSKKTMTRRALFTSVISLILCCAMLMGTTFAWFTDSVTSGNNLIQAGNLDVELYHSDKSATGEKVDGNTKLFDDVTLWEPGAVAYENFVVKNEGNLALKYQMNMNFQNATNNGNGGTLADVLKVAVVEGGFNATNDREEAKKLTYGYNLSTFTLDGVLEAESESKTYGVVVYWEPSDIDNNYNMNNAHTEVLTIDLGVNLFATQQMYESDSFGPDYDESVWDKAMKVMNAQELQAAIDAGETAIVLSADIKATESIEIPAGKTVALNLNGHTIKGTGLDAEGKKAHVLVNNGTLTLVDGTVESTGENGGSAVYNAEGATMDINNATLIGAPKVDGGYPSYAVNNYGTATISNTTVTSIHGGICSYGANAVITLNNVTATLAPSGEKTGMTSHVLYTYENGKIIVNSGTYTNSASDATSTGGTVVCNYSESTTIEIKGGTFKGGCGLSEYSTGDIIVTGGTFDKSPSAYVAEGYKAQLTGGTYHVVPEAIDAVVSTNEELAAALQSGGKEIILTAGKFTADLYSIASRDSLVITGQGASTELNFANQQVRLDLFDKLTISNCNIQRMATKAWGHLVFGSSKKSGGVYTISNCIFDGVGTQGIYVNQDVDATINIEDCTFNGDFGSEGAITIQDNDAKFTVNVNDCEFNNIPGTSHDIYVKPYKNGAWSLNVDGKVWVATAKQLAAALTSDAAKIDVVLMNDIDCPISSLGQQTGGSGEYKLGGDSTNTINLDLNRNELNITTTYWSVIGAKNANATFTIKNGYMTSSQETGTWNSYDLSFANCNYVIDDVTFDKAIAFTNTGKNVKLTDVTISETHDYYAMWISAVGQNVEIDGLTVNSAGRGIKIDEQYVDAPAKVTLKVSNATFNTANKAAIMVKSAAGADITLENVNIDNVAADTTNAVWVDEDAAAYADLVTVNGGAPIVEA